MACSSSHIDEIIVDCSVGRKWERKTGVLNGSHATSRSLHKFNELDFSFITLTNGGILVWVTA